MPQTAGFARTLASRLVGATLLALLCFGLGRTLDARSAAPAPTGVDLTRSVADLIRHKAAADSGRATILDPQGVLR